MILAQFGQDEDRPIRITPGGIIPTPAAPADLPSDLPSFPSDQIIDVAPSASQEPGPIRLPVLTVRAAPKPTKTGLSSGQIGGLFAVAGILIGGLIAVAIVRTTPKHARRRRYN